MTGQEKQTKLELAKEERANLEAEYKELCEDWRLRDGYVLDKLGTAGMLFIYLGVAVVTTANMPILRLLLLLIGALFSFILSISVAKDTYYRDGTEKLLKRLSAKLSLNDSLQTLKALKGFDDGLNFQELQYPRKIIIERDKSSLVIPRWLRDCLLNRTTFRWILAFYLGALCIFSILFILVLVDSWIYWKYGLRLPI